MVEPRLKDTGVAFGKEEGQATAGSSKDVMMGSVEARNKALASESAEVIGHLASAVMWLTEMGRYQRTQSGVGEAVGQVAELAQAGKEGHDTGFAEGKAGR